MEKKVYVSPVVEAVQVEACDMMAQSVVSNSLGIYFGGDASAMDMDIIEADGNKNGGWDIW